MEMIMFNKAIKTGLCTAMALAVSGEVLAEQWDVSLWGK
ncbi:MAG: hypothetical protein ACI9MN_001227, partial [Saprospiraceae bacterium]